MGQSQVMEGPSSVRLGDATAHTVCFARAGCEEYFVTVTRAEGEAYRTMFERAAEAVRDANAAIVSMTVAGVPFQSTTLGRAFGAVDWPVTWIDRSPITAAAGVHIWAVAGPAPTPLMNGGVTIGTKFDDSWATYCRIGGLVPRGVGTDSSDRQTSSVLSAMEHALRAAGLDFGDTVRTWFFNRSIASWYGDFNRARSRFFDERDVFQRLVPASTGVGGGDLGDAALTAGLLAVRPKDATVSVAAVPSPLQCPATSYGSAFSRAVEIVLPDHARLLVSGTASISPEGLTESAGNFEAQVDKTFEVVGALLESCGYVWGDVTHGVAYVKRAQDIALAAQRMNRRHIEPLPVLVVHADICRDDLLFELEVDAMAPRAPGANGPA